MTHVVITGAADGIGKALAGAYIAAGYRVTGIDVDAARAEATQQELGEQITFIVADLTDVAVVEDVANQLADAGTPVDVLVNNAGISEVGYFQQTNPARQRAVIQLNFVAPLLLTRHLLAVNALRTDGSVVFMSSLSRYVSYPGASVYAATKDGIASYARSLAVGYPRLHVLTVYPGPTRTAHARRYSPDNAREDKRMAPEVLAGHILRAVEKRQRILIPGAANWTFAVLGRWFPALTNTIMRKTLLEKFPNPEQEPGS